MAMTSRNSSSSFSPWKYLLPGSSLESETKSKKYSSSFPLAPLKYLIGGFASGLIFGSITPLLKGESSRSAAEKGPRLGLNHAALFGFYYVCSSAMSYFRRDSKFWNPVLPLVATCTLLPDPISATQFATSLAAFEMVNRGGRLGFLMGGESF